jgi:hypothetical protein
MAEKRNIHIRERVLHGGSDLAIQRHEVPRLVYIHYQRWRIRNPLESLLVMATVQQKVVGGYAAPIVDTHNTCSA